jgi:nitroimidazol reductase NimA-like FMN-containing flavoprotein (pyridoxamine 5'-phosphate oxidase superfamily)
MNPNILGSCIKVTHDYFVTRRSIIIFDHAASMLKRYHMHKSEREMTDQEEIMNVLKRGKFVILALSQNDEPYVLTLSYGLDEEASCLYFHTAHKGLKLDIIKSNSKACGTVIEDLGYVHGECSHKFRSVVISGTMSIVSDLEEKKHGMMAMFKHLEEDPDAMRERFLKNNDVYSKVNILRMDIMEMTGKESS